MATFYLTGGGVSLSIYNSRKRGHLTSFEKTSEGLNKICELKQGMNKGRG